MKNIAIFLLIVCFCLLFINENSAKQKKQKKVKTESIKSYPKTGKARLDSLLSELPQKSEFQDTSYVKLLGNLSHEYHTIDQEKGIEFAQKALILAEKLDFKVYIPDIYMVWGNNLNMSFKLTEAIEKYSEALKLYQEYNIPRGVSAICNNIGYAYSRMGDTTKAMEYWNKSLENSKKFGYNEKIAFVYSKIAAMNLNFGRLQTAIDYYNKLISFSEANDLKQDLGHAYGALGWVYSKISDFSKALELFEKARKVYKEIGNIEKEAEVISNIGGIYSSHGDNNKAIEYYMQSLKINQELGLISGIAYDYGSIAQSYFYMNNFPKMFEYLNKAIEINESINNKKLLARNYNVLGCYFSTINEKDSAEIYLLKGLDLYNELNDIPSTTELMINLARLYSTNADYAKALEYAYKALKIAEQLGDLIAQGVCYQLLGVVNANLLDYEKAIQFSTKALDIFKKTENLPEIVVTLINLGSNYYMTGKTDKAMELFIESLEISEKIGDRISNAYVYSNLGAINTQNKNYFEALKNYQDAEDIMVKFGIKENLSSIYYSKAEIYSSMAYLDSAKYTETERDSLLLLSLNLLNQAYDLAEKGKEAEIMISSLEKIYIINFDLRNWEQALKYYKKAVKLKDSIYSGENQKKIAELEAKKDLEIKQKENEVLRNKTLLQESEISRRKQELTNLNNLQRIQKLELDKRNLDIISKNNTLDLLKKDKELKELEISQKNIESKKKEKEIELLNKNRQYQEVIRNSLFGGIGLLSSLAVILLLFFKRKSKDNKIIQAEKEKSDRLLLNVLPEQIANRLKAGEAPIADHFDEASVVFIDIVDFTKKSANTNPKEIVAILNVLYSKLDVIAKKHNLEKIKTIGDCYMAASGIPIVDKDHANKAAKFAIDAMSALKDYDTGKGTILNFRCGIDCGQVVAGVIGENKFIYDIWGDMVNTASRMETNGIAGRIQCTERFKEKLYPTLTFPLLKGGNQEYPLFSNEGTKGWFFEERGEIEIKGKGMMKTYF